MTRVASVSLAVILVCTSVVAQQPHSLECRESGHDRDERRPRCSPDCQERRNHDCARNRHGKAPWQVPEAPASRSSLLGHAHVRTLADG